MSQIEVIKNQAIRNGAVRISTTTEKAVLIPSFIISKYGCAAAHAS